MNLRMTFRIALLTLIFGLMVFLVIRTCRAEAERRALKADLIELSGVRYGLFNVDEWKQILVEILSSKINEINLEGANREEMRRQISDLLNSVVDGIEQRYYENRSKSLKGMLQMGVASLTGMFEQIREDIPVITDQLIAFLDDPANKRALTRYLTDQLSIYTDETFARIDYSLHDAILKRHEFEDRQKAIAGLDVMLSQETKSTWLLHLALLILTLVTILFVLLLPRISGTEFLIVTLICASLLYAGLILPMIEIDARIDQMSFALMGEEVLFENQVLYYKSKSILEVVELMIRQGTPQLILVGILVLTFSVLFPVTKLITSLFYVYKPELRSRKIMRFMVFRTGKWSMADVMVVTIFMAYLGFSGMISEQLRQLDGIARNVEVLTTDQSRLLIGFYAFTGFAILSLISAHKLQYALRKTG